MLRLSLAGLHSAFTSLSKGELSALIAKLADDLADPADRKMPQPWKATLLICSAIQDGRRERTVATSLSAALGNVRFNR
jgi:hypothetical protein